MNLIIDKAARDASHINALLQSKNSEEMGELRKQLEDRTIIDQIQALGYTLVTYCRYGSAAPTWEEITEDLRMLYFDKFGPDDYLNCILQQLPDLIKGFVDLDMFCGTLTYVDQHCGWY